MRSARGTRTALLIYASAALVATIYGQSVSATYLMGNWSVLLGPLLTFVPPLLYQPVWLILCNACGVAGLVLCLRVRHIAVWVLFALGWFFTGGGLFALLVV